MSAAPLAGMRVVELGSRLAAGVCGRLLADLGAEVLVVEPRGRIAGGKWADRALATVGKHSVLCDPANQADVEAVATLVGGADVTLVCGDVDTLPAALAAALATCPIVCAITAFGTSGPLAGETADETTLQAMTGLLATTGFADRAPVPIGVPFIELSSAIYAATAVALAWRVLQRDGLGQRVEVALYDAAVNALTTFLPGYFAGQPTRRLGNGHAMAVPWNAYRATDGWILICSANDAQWRRLAALIDPALAGDARFTLRARLARRAEIDALVSAWTVRHARDALVAQLSAAGVACGAIVSADQLGEEPNLALRGLVATVRDPVSGTLLRLPNAVVRLDDESAAPDAPRAAPVIPLPDSARALVSVPRARHAAGSAAAGIAAGPAQAGAGRAARAPFAGLRVLEIGQFTTAPLAGRSLANFGADVIKLEPEEGESARTWAPLRNGTSHFFVMSNGTKRSVGIDLRSAAGQARLAGLLAGADVLVENLKPGALARLGFSAARLTALYPRLVYCAISGFGAHSAYPGRPAFDTVVQAMSGMMDATRDDGIPLKSGISSADIAGGQMGMLAIAAALQRREQTGRGGVIDLAMQDIGAWFTQTLWNPRGAPGTGAAPPRDAAQRAGAASRGGQGVSPAIADLAAVGAHPQTAARDLIVRRRDADGIEWELLGSPMRLARTPAVIGTPLGRPVAGEVGWADDEDGH